MSELRDEELVAVAKEGDRQALEELVARHQGRVYRFSMKMCRNSEDAEEVLQDTLMAMARTLQDFRGASSVPTWLYTIARSFCIKRRRKSKFAPTEETSLESESDGEVLSLAHPARPPDEEVAGSQLVQALDDAIGQLEPKYREVLVLRDVEGLTSPQVAEVLGLSVEAIKSRLHRARLAVREQLAPFLEAPSATESGCPDVLSALSQRLENDIDPDLCAEMERHLERCPNCRGACDSLRRTLAMCRNIPSPDVPDAVQESVRRAVRGFIGANA